MRRSEPIMELIRGDHTILMFLFKDTPDVLYRTRNHDHASGVLGMCSRASAVGISAYRDHGWPYDRPHRQPPMFYVAEMGGHHHVFEKHPRMSLGDRVLCRAASERDASDLLWAARRAATIGAMLDYMGVSDAAN